jgi:DMSO/TMAO reductase YedYZ molybdopterin-dependent catalytic subunit
MSQISRGFRGHRPPVAGARVPPGQHVVDEFPVLSVGTTPHTPPLDAWTFGITGAIDEPVSWTWEALSALPAETPTVDMHYVTAWSKLDTT